MEFGILRVHLQRFRKQGAGLSDAVLLDQLTDPGRRSGVTEKLANASLLFCSLFDCHDALAHKDRYRTSLDSFIYHHHFPPSEVLADQVPQTGRRWSHWRLGVSAVEVSSSLKDFESLFNAV